MRATRSLRFRLAVTYAGIALLTVAVLGGVLLLVLGDYYARSEDAYLQASADRIVGEPPPLDDSAKLAYWVQLAALTTQTRVRVVESDGTVLADSGSPRELDPGAVVSVDDDERRPGGPGGHERLPEPLGQGLFGGANANASRSDRTLLVEVEGSGGSFIQLSEAPASGNDALVGVAQAVALIPGISRSGITISAALAAGYRREDAARFSFLLSTPIIAGAAVFKLKDVAIEGHAAWACILGTLCAAVVGYLAIRFLIRYLEQHSLNIFVWYRLALAALAVLFWAVR